VITAIIPSAARVGDTVKVTGKNFGFDRTKGTVTFNSGIAATQVIVWNDTTITLKVPQGTQTGAVTVTVNNLTSNSATFTVTTVPVPLITSLTPSAARVKDTISIDGNNFGTDKTKGYIQFTGTTAYSTGIISWTNTNIRVVVPYNITTGPLTVNVNYVASNQVLFTLDTTPWIDQVYHTGQGWLGYPKRSWALPGKMVEISGRNFGWPDTAKVQFDNLTVPVYGFTQDYESVLAPSTTGGAVSVSVKTKSGLVSNSKPFYVGVPFDTLKAHRKVRIDIEFYITYVDKTSGQTQTAGVVFGGIANVTWGTDGFTASASDFSPTKTGTLKVTLSPDGTKMTRLELNYANTAAPHESVQYVGEDIIGRTNSTYNYIQLEYYVKGYDAVRNSTRQLSGTYTPLQTAYPITGLREGFDSYISIMIMDLDVS
jgi:hypothetical protein